MKTITREIVIKSIMYDTVYGKNINKEVCYVYKIETYAPLNLHAMQFTIIESVKVPERLDEFMVLHGVGQSEILEFLNKNYKKQ